MTLVQRRKLGRGLAGYDPAHTLASGKAYTEKLNAECNANWDIVCDNDTCM